MKKVKFCFGIHNHQPVGNFGWVIEEAYQKSYLPFLRLLEKYPGFRISLHFTGILLDWIRENHTDGIELVKTLVGKGQIELLTGGHFEPILPVIPDRDKLGQIAMLTENIEKTFGVVPTGMWLAERVWEPSLPKILNQAGVKYTILDDIHFRYSGLTESQLNGYYITEEEGSTVALFPISKKLRYAIPFADPEVTLEHLRSLANEDCTNVAIYADDGEKFGVWPETYEHCFEKGWLERFFKLICANLDWIEMKHFGEVLNENNPLGTIYLPTASYSEMNEWAMPVAAIERYDSFVERLKRDHLLEDFGSFVKGGFWRNFLTKYPESNQLHKRMLSVSRQLEENKSRLSEKNYLQAQKHLYAGQCNCPYWHGVFGGLYLPHLRGALYSELIAAENVIRNGLSKKRDVLELEITDLDCDGEEELIVTSVSSKTIVKPSAGGAIIELDSFAAEKNLIDIVGRRREGYHRKLLTRHQQPEGAKSIHDRVLVKEEGLEQLLVEDWYRRGMLIDHFFGEGTTLEEFSSSRYSEAGDFVNQRYDHTVRKNKTALEIDLARNGQVWHQGRHSAISLCKTVVFAKAGGVKIKYRLKNLHDQSLSLHFGVEFGFGSFTFPMSESSFSVGNNNPIKQNLPVEIAGQDQIELISRLHQFQCLLRFDRLGSVWVHPLWTVSLSEGGFEKVYQGSIIVPNWRLALEPGEEWQYSLELLMGKTGRMDDAKTLSKKIKIEDAV